MSTQSAFIIKLRGLPWNVTVEDIVEFLKGVDVSNGDKGVHLITSPKDGRPNGEAFVECSTEKDYNLAFDFNKKVMGHRYIEVFSAKQDEFEYIMKKQNVVQQDTFVKLRGLPYRVSHDEIEQFFDGLELKKDRDDSIHIVMDNRGRATGEAFVQFVSPADTEKALKRNREKIGHRYIEIFRSSASEYRHSIHYNRPGPYDRNDRNGNGRSGLNVSGFTRNNNRNFKGGERRGNDNRNLPSPWAIEDSPWKKHNNDNLNNFNLNVGNFNNGYSSNSGTNNGYNNSNDFNNLFSANNNNGNNNFAGNNFGSNYAGNSGNDYNNRLDSNFTNDNFGNESNYENRGGFDRISGNNAGGNEEIAKSGACSSNGSLAGNTNTNNNNWNNQEMLCIHLRGMPYNCDEEDIIKFFAPVKPINATVIFNNRGLHSGEADAYFSSQTDVAQAMTKHKQKMGSRYIELFNMSNNNSNNNNATREKRRNDSYNGSRRF